MRQRTSRFRLEALWAADSRLPWIWMHHPWNDCERVRHVMLSFITLLWEGTIRSTSAPAATSLITASLDHRDRTSLRNLALAQILCVLLMLDPLFLLAHATSGAHTAGSAKVEAMEIGQDIWPRNNEITVTPCCTTSHDTNLAWYNLDRARTRGALDPLYPGMTRDWL